MRWTKPLAIALVINIHTSGCIGGLLSVSAAMAASISSYDTDESILMTIAEPEDFLCTNQSLVRDDEGAEIADENTEGGCSSESCLERSHQDRKERHLLADLIDAGEEIIVVSFHTPMYENKTEMPLLALRSPPLFEYAEQHARSLVKRE